mmetsp:Transcript_28610/g.92108  ORF Transcript_28610/g.92108 Transcript_28610/m.92108 type:complete len:174 (-) Transcript_28610:383-904(-)|eukprot:CAMPEP_0118902178 /NCGR_PEP_ID=MMETSP1166-20130328/7581_1 /TAXON_ID=1104430 /ORGANISM="Chrysoreinhardia sp, Strain CCMP3193" /LENGTH=173 /DNA_ID=CAMNT_0006841381 /DNA_START=68 /DNA_END=589 /DNA_ORIENTATION=+
MEALLKNEAATKVLKVVLKNVASDPTNEKFRRVRLDGSAGGKLRSSPHAMELLRGLGFAEVATAEGVFLVKEEAPVDLASKVAAIVGDLEKATPAAAPQEKLSLKAQARRDAEKRKAAEQEAARKHRDEVRKQIQRDNRARKEDPNWKPGNGVSKGGKAIDTFRGKYGEDKGG